MSDTLMQLGKTCKLLRSFSYLLFIGLLMSLLVGITLRTQSNRAGLFGIIDRIKLLTSKDYKPEKFNLAEIEAKMKGKNSSVADAVKGPNRGFWKPILVNWLMAGIPSLTAILLANHFLAYIETAAGFLAPVFLILFPCLLTIKLHKDGIAPLSKFSYAFIWAYLVIAMVWSYFALSVNLYLILTGNH